MHSRRKYHPRSKIKSTPNLLQCDACNETAKQCDSLKSVSNFKLCEKCWKTCEEDIMRSEQPRPKSQTTNQKCAKKSHHLEKPNIEKIFVCKEVPSNKFDLKTKMFDQSKQPLRCPYPNCPMLISTLKFGTHFRTDHHDVPFFPVNLETRISWQIMPKVIHTSLPQCIGVLRLKNGRLCPCESGISMRSYANIEPIVVVMCLRPENTRKTAAFNDDDHMYLWLASNILMNNCYTVAASSIDNFLRLKFTGALYTINEFPKKMTEGACISLTHFHLNAMTKNATQDLTIDVVIHDQESLK